MSKPLNKLIRIGANNDTINYLLKSIADAGEDVNCEFVQQLSMIKFENEDVNDLLRNKISKYLILKAFQNIEEQFLMLMQIEDIDDEAKQIIQVIASSILLIQPISISENHFTGLVSQTMDVFAHHVNNSLKKSMIIGGEVEEHYKVILTLIEDVNKFITQLPCLEESFKNNYTSYLDCAIPILKYYPTGIYSLHQIVSQIFMALQQNVKVCISCKDCKDKETCDQKDKHTIN